nr:hypothetical protein [Clostridiales bacterium]
MKKILLLSLLIYTVIGSAQTEELLKMYQKLTGKDLSTEIKKLKEKDSPNKLKKETAEIDTVLQQSDDKTGFSPDSLEVKTYFEKYVSGEL